MTTVLLDNQRGRLLFTLTSISARRVLLAIQRYSATTTINRFMVGFGWRKPDFLPVVVSFLSGECQSMSWADMVLGGVLKFA